MPLYEFRCESCGHEARSIMALLGSPSDDLRDVRRPAEEAPVGPGGPVQGVGLLPDRLRQVGERGGLRRKEGPRGAAEAKPRERSRRRGEILRRGEVFRRRQGLRGGKSSGEAKSSGRDEVRDGRRHRGWFGGRCEDGGLTRVAALLAAALVAIAFPLRAAAGPPASSPGGAWLRYPLPGAEVKSLAAEPRAPGLFFAGTALGGVYRSTDGGRSWSSPPGGAPFPGYSVTSLVPDPQRAGTVWAGLTGVVKGGLLVRSDDGARSWAVVRRWEERAEARVVAVAVLRGRKVVAVGGDTGPRGLGGRRRHVASVAAASRPGQRRLVPRVPPAEAGRPLHGLLPPSVPLDGPRPLVEADRRRDGRGHAGLPPRLLADRPGRHLGGDVRLGLPDDRRGRDLEALQGRPDRPADARRDARPAQPVPGPGGNDGRALREPGRRAGASGASRARRRSSTGSSSTPRTPPSSSWRRRRKESSRSEDGGVTLVESNAGLSEARVSGRGRHGFGRRRRRAGRGRRERRALGARPRDGEGGAARGLSRRHGPRAPLERRAAPRRDARRPLARAGAGSAVRTGPRRPGPRPRRRRRPALRGDERGGVRVARRRQLVGPRRHAADEGRRGPLEPRTRGRGRGARRPLLGEDPLVERPGLRPRGAARGRPAR